MTIDCTPHQVRSPIERVAFEGAMACLDLWYTHALTTALLVHP